MLKPSVESLRGAVYLSLEFRACSKVATAFVATLASEVCMLSGRKNVRRSEGRQALFQDAVSAVVGGLLVNRQKAAGAEHTRSRISGHGTVSVPLPSGLSYRRRAKESFTGERVPFRQFNAALQGLQEAGYVETAKGHRQFHGAKSDPGGFVGRSHTFRLWPTPRLLRAAEAAGLKPADVRRHFHPDAATPAPVVLHELKEWRGGEKAKGERLLLPKNIKADRIAAEVNAMNAFAVAHRVEVAGGRADVAWQRAFNIDFDLHGRWYARGESYQGLPGDERHNLITVDGEACAEVDICASHLTCLYGHLGLLFDPELDPYDVFGVPRVVVKAWIMASLGRGAALSGRAWPHKAMQHAWEKENLDLRAYPLPAVSQAVLGRHPTLADLPIRFESLGRRYGVNAGKVLSLFLMGLEARVLTTATLGLKMQGVLALPVHDSLVVPQSAVQATGMSLTAAFQEHLGAIPRLRVKAGATTLRWAEPVAARV